MPFSNPILAGTDLIRSAIRSPNYEPGVSGWTINQDGSAEFDDVDIRGTISATAARALTADNADFATAADTANTANTANSAETANTANSATTADSATTAANADNADAVNGPVTSTDMNAQSANYVPGGAEDPGLGWMIDSAGNAEFNNITARGDMEGSVGAFDNLIANASFNYLGEELQSVIDPKPRGLVAYHQRTTNSVLANLNVEQKVARLSVPVLANRTYRIRVNTGCYTTAGQSGLASVYLRYTLDGTEPTVSSPVYHQTAEFLPSGGLVIEYNIDRIYRDTFDHTLKLLLTFKGGVGASQFGTYGAFNWPTLMYAQDIGNTLPLLGANDDGVTVPPATFRSFDIQPYASRSYTGSGALYTPGSGDIQQYCMQGDIGVDGNRRSWIWFDANDTAGGNGLGSLNDMQGAVSFDYFDVFLYYTHWYFSTGGTAFIGHHNSNVVTNTEQGGGAYGEKTENWAGRNIGKWVSLLGTNIATAAAAGTIEGLILGNTGSATLNHYGYAFGASQGLGFKPGLRAGYYK